MPQVATDIRTVWAVNQWGEENIISEFLNFVHQKKMSGFCWPLHPGGQATMGFKEGERQECTRKRSFRGFLYKQTLNDRSRPKPEVQCTNLNVWKYCGSKRLYLPDLGEKRDGDKDGSIPDVTVP